MGPSQAPDEARRWAPTAPRADSGRHRGRYDAGMATPKGFGTIATPADLVEKLRHDLARMERDPLDVYAAFDFMVTADSLPDWLGWADAVKKRTDDPLRTLVHDLADGAKHMLPRIKSAVPHEIVERSGAYDDPLDTYDNPGDTYDDPGGLDVSSTATRTTAIDLARGVLAYWETMIDTKKPPPGE